MNDSGAFTFEDTNLFRTIWALLCITWEGDLADGAVVGYKRVTVRALVGPRHQFEPTKRTVEIQRSLTVRADIIFLPNKLSTGGTKSRAAVAAKTVFQENG
jgi:hypothetical protein